ncbi:MAG: LPS-assembly protein LptD [Deltaproteobacteria bacterium]|nr:LPS-assembly protein LptD [Deltaproteobacteria bacterium]
MTVFADRIDFDHEAQLGIAEGGVTVVDGTSVMRCRRVEITFPDGAASFERVALRIKKRRVGGVKDVASGRALLTSGGDALIVGAARVERIDRRKLTLEDASVTLCDCGQGSPPSWHIEASRASVDLDSGAWLFFPRFFISLPIDGVGPETSSVLRAPPRFKLPASRPMSRRRRRRAATSTNVTAKSANVTTMSANAKAMSANAKAKSANAKAKSTNVKAKSTNVKAKSTNVKAMSASATATATATAARLQVPILALPVFYLPLGARRTGFLPPHFSFSESAGYTIMQPFFLTLGESYDATFEPTYMSWRGPAGAIQARWAPSSTTKGQVDAKLVLDYGERAAVRPGDPGSIRFVKSRDTPLARFAVGGRHVTTMEDGALVADLTLLGDPAYLSEFSDGFLERQTETARSRVTLHRDFGPFVHVAVGAQLLEDLRGSSYPRVEGGPTTPREVKIFSDAPEGAGEIRYRLFDLRIDGALAPLGWRTAPLLGGARASVQAFTAPRPEVARFLRADMRPQFVMPLDLDGWATLEPSLALRLTAWQGRVAGASVSASRLGVVAGLRLATELSRPFEHGRLLHTVTPSVEHRLIPRVWTSGADLSSFSTGDEVDLLQAAHQLRARLISELWDGVDGRRLGGVELSLGRNINEVSTANRTSDLVVSFDVESFGEAWPIRIAVNGDAAFGVHDRRVRISEAAGGFSITRAKGGDRFAMSAGFFAARLPETTFIAPEELMASDTIPREAYRSLADYRALTPTERVDQLPWSAFRGLSLSADVKLLKPVVLSGAAVLALGEMRTQEEVYGRASLVRAAYGTLGWTSPCACWGAAITTRYAVDQGLSYNFVLDLAQLGRVSSKTP